MDWLGCSLIHTTMFNFRIHPCRTRYSGDFKCLQTLLAQFYFEMPGMHRSISHNRTISSRQNVANTDCQIQDMRFETCHYYWAKSQRSFWNEYTILNRRRISLVVSRLYEQQHCVDMLLSVCLCWYLLSDLLLLVDFVLTHLVLVCLQTCQTTAVLGAAEEAGAFGSRHDQTHHTEPAEKGQDAHQGTKRTALGGGKQHWRGQPCSIRWPVQSHHLFWQGTTVMIS